MGLPNHHQTRWTPANLSLLGRESDKGIAVSLGITVAAVGIRRRMLGIPPPTKPRPRRWTRTMISKLGKVTDAVIASAYDLNYQAVVAKRRSLGIPGYRGK